MPASASATVSQSTNTARPRCHATTAFNTSQAPLTPSRTAPAMAERRNLGINGPLIATKENAGRKMPSVATPSLAPEKN
jgi:hypothetical protein